MDPNNPDEKPTAAVKRAVLVIALQCVSLDDFYIAPESMEVIRAAYSKNPLEGAHPCVKGCTMAAAVVTDALTGSGFFS